MDDNSELGAFAGRYTVDNGRRGRQALLLFLLGVVVTPVSVVLAIPAYDSPSTTAGAFPSILIGCGLGLLLVGGWMGVVFRTHSGEVFELHERGVVHAFGDKRRTVSFDDVTEIVDNGKDNAFARKFGGDVNVTLKPAQGRGITITGLTHGAEELVSAVRRGIEPKPETG